MIIKYGDICQTDCDVIINASNGLGYMGGKQGIKRKLPGVAESMHYLSKGKIEREAKRICQASSILGLAPGSVFVTSAEGLKSLYVIHAVTMRFPGTFARKKTVLSLLPKILETARNVGAKSIAIPLLGSGTGGLSESSILKIYEQTIGDIDDIEIYVYIYNNH